MNPRLALGFVVALAGCTTTPVPPPELISAETAAAHLSARSLRDPGLHRFLVDNLGRDPGESWDFEALNWAAFYLQPSLEVARAQWAGAKAATRVAGERPNPSLTLTPGYNFTREAGLSPWMPAVNLDFLFAASTRRNRQVEAARGEAEAARLSVFVAAWQVRSELRRALGEVDAATRRAAQARLQSEAQRSIVALLQQRFEAGSISANEVSQARSALLRAESAAADAQGQTLTARTHVAAAIGLPASALEGVSLPAPASLAVPLPAVAAAREEALRSRADVLMALARYQAAHAALQVEVTKRWPDLHLGPGYQWDQGSNKWTLAVGFELPVFHHNEAAIAAATARRAEAAAQFNLTQAQALAAIEQALAAREAAQVQLTRVTQLRDEAQRQEARLRERMEAGAGDRLELMTARVEVGIADSAILEAEIARATGDGQLEDALQVPLPHLATLAAPISSTAPHP